MHHVRQPRSIHTLTIEERGFVTRSDWHAGCLTSWSMRFQDEHLVVLIGASDGLRNIHRRCAQRGVECASPVSALHAVRRFLFLENPSAATLIASLDVQTRQVFGVELEVFIAAARALPGEVRCVGLLDSPADMAEVASLGCDWYLHDSTQAEHIVSLVLQGEDTSRAWRDVSGRPLISTGRIEDSAFGVDDRTQQKPAVRPPAPPDIHTNPLARDRHHRWRT